MLQMVSRVWRVSVGVAASVLAGAALWTAGSVAHASGVVWSVGVNTPVVTVGAGSAYPVGHVVAAPMVRAPAYVQPAPVYVQPAQVVVQRPPVYVQPAPVVVAPPAVAYPYAYGAYPAYPRQHHHHHHHRPHPHWGNWDRY